MYRPGQIITIRLDFADVTFICRIRKRKDKGRTLYLLPKKVADKLPYECKVVIEKIITKRKVQL